MSVDCCPGCGERTFLMPLHGGTPAFPRIRKHRAWQKFVAAYKKALRDFYTDVAATIGGAVIIVDTDLKTVDGMELIPVPVKH